MKIAFSCPACAKKLSADAGLAGRSGRCRGCGQRIVVPAASTASAGHRRADHGTGSTPGQRRTAEPAKSPPEEDELPDWRAAVASQLLASARNGGTTGRRAGATDVHRDAGPKAALGSGYRLRPITPAAVPVLPPPDQRDTRLSQPVDPPPEDDFEPTAPPVARPAAEQALGPTPLVLAYRWLFGHLVRVTMWISETSYTVSFVVIILAIASGMAGRHTLAQWGTLAIIALNLAGLAGDLASLVALSFRRSPMQGALFLVPPFTLYYLWSDWQRYRDAIGRMRIPLVTLTLVVVAYLFVPWLRGGPTGEGRLAGSVERMIGEIEQDFGRPQGAIDDGIKKARVWLREAVPGDTSSPSNARGIDRQAPRGDP